jgi:protein-tyrosine-phosphatase
LPNFKDNISTMSLRSEITPTHRARKIPEGDVQLHWSFDDPADAQVSGSDGLQVFRRVRDEIDEQVRK